MKSKRPLSKLRNIMFLLILVAAVITGVYGADKPSFLTTEALLDAWEANYGNITTFHISFSEELQSITTTTGDNINNDDGLLRLHHVDMTKDKTNGRYHVKLSYEEEGITDNIGTTQEFSYDGEITQQYYGNTAFSAYIKQGLTNDSIPILDKSFEKYLLLRKRKGGLPENEYPDGLHLSSWLRKKNDRFKLRVGPQLEVVNGQECHVFEAVIDADNIIRVWLAHDKNMLPMKYEEISLGITRDKMEVFVVTSRETDRGTVWFPAEVVYKEYFESGRGGKGQPRYITYKCHINEFKQNISVNQDDFRFDFPNGTRVTDLITGLNYTVGVKGIDDSVDEVIPMESLETDDPNSNSDLHNKKPTMKELPKEPKLINKEPVIKELPKEQRPSRTKMDVSNIDSSKNISKLLIVAGIVVLVFGIMIFFWVRLRIKD